MCSTVAAARTHLASEHERQRPVAADDLTLAHDRRETLKILDRQRHQSRDARQTDSTRARLVAPSVRSFRGSMLLGAAERWRGRNPTVVLPRSWFRRFQPRLKRRRDATQTHGGETPRTIQNSSLSLSPPHPRFPLSVYKINRKVCTQCAAAIIYSEVALFLSLILTLFLYLLYTGSQNLHSTKKELRPKVPGAALCLRRSSQA